MTKTLSDLLNWIRGKVLSYLVIVLVILIGSWAASELHTINSKEALVSTIDARIAIVEMPLAHANIELSTFSKAIDAQISSLKASSAQAFAAAQA